MFEIGIKKFRHARPVDSICEGGKAAQIHKQDDSVDFLQRGDREWHLEDQIIGQTLADELMQNREIQFRIGTGQGSMQFDQVDIGQ